MKIENSTSPNFKVQPGTDNREPITDHLPTPLFIFDLDGTLFKTESVTVPAVQSVFTNYGIAPPASETICSFFGKPGAVFHRWLKSITPEKIHPELIPEIDRREMENIGITGTLYPGIMTCLENLQSQNATLAICTNGTREYVNRVLDTMEINHFFHHIRFREYPGDSKENMTAEILDKTGIRRGVLTGDRGVLTGDRGILTGDRAEDVHAAHKNGLKAVGALYGYGSREELTGADAHVLNPKNLLNTLINI